MQNLNTYENKKKKKTFGGIQHMIHLRTKIWQTSWLEKEQEPVLLFCKLKVETNITIQQGVM